MTACSGQIPPQYYIRPVSYDPARAGVVVTYYAEDRVTFTPINPGEQFSHAGGGFGLMV